MYCDHYGFTGRPFQLTPDPRFYFNSATHRKAMAYLGYGLAQGEGFIVITGEVGAGKTTLAGHLTATVDPARLTVVKLVSTQVEGDDMLRLTAQALGLSTDGVAKAQLLHRVERFLQTQAREGKRTLLVVDEAQNLGVTALEELRMLSNFQNGEQALLQIFLLGQPEFRDQLAKSERLEQLRQRVIATHHLEPMEAHEVEPYIVHRLALVDWQGNPQFTPAAFQALARHSGGVPRKLNMLATRVLLHGAVEGLARIDGIDVDVVAGDLAGGVDAPEQPEAAAPTSERITPAVVFEPEMVSEPDPVAEPEPEPAPAPRLAPAFSSYEPEPAGRPLPMLADPVPDHDGDPETVFEPKLRFRAADPELAPPTDAETLWIARLEALEARVDEQDAALRRVLTLLVDWVERDAERAHDGPHVKAA